MSTLPVEEKSGRGRKETAWKCRVVLKTALNVIEVAALLVLFIVCFMFLLIHVDNHNKKVLEYGEKGQEGLLDLYLIEFKDQLQEEMLEKARHWLFLIIAFICVCTIARSYSKRNEAHDELHHFALLRRYFHAVALQDLRRYRADAEYEAIAIQNYLAAQRIK